MKEIGPYTDEEAMEYFFNDSVGKELDALRLSSIVRRWVNIDLPILMNKEFDDYLEKIAEYMKSDKEYNWGHEMTREQWNLFVKDAVEEVAHIIQKFWLRMWSNDSLKVLGKMLEHGERIKPCKGVEISRYQVEEEFARREEKPKEKDIPWPFFDCLP